MEKKNPLSEKKRGQLELVLIGLPFVIVTVSFFLLPDKIAVQNSFFRILETGNKLALFVIPVLSLLVHLMFKLIINFSGKQNESQEAKEATDMFRRISLMLLIFFAVITAVSVLQAFMG